MKLKNISSCRVLGAGGTRRWGLEYGIGRGDEVFVVAEIGRVLRRSDGIETDLHISPESAVVSDARSGDPSHGWKFITFQRVCPATSATPVSSDSAR
ncbi:MAG TPA: hypothetical protein PKK74_09025 [Candidatus Methanoculleus thermohydrogenotrophicum]|nr:hypothetical protein [Candidatus Methanoculleus thermohydrogenotrophicum]HPZ38854.1 hypothetical protein [Candidatus Methanoculleus thermohydrogenotrophicum]